QLRHVEHLLDQRLRRRNPHNVFAGLANLRLVAAALSLGGRALGRDDSRRGDQRKNAQKFECSTHTQSPVAPEVYLPGVILSLTVLSIDICWVCPPIFTVIDLCVFGVVSPLGTRESSRTVMMPVPEPLEASS